MLVGVAWRSSSTTVLLQHNRLKYNSVEVDIGIGQPSVAFVLSRSRDEISSQGVQPLSIGGVFLVVV